MYCTFPPFFLGKGVDWVSVLAGVNLESGCGWGWGCLLQSWFADTSIPITGELIQFHVSRVFILYVWSRKGSIMRCYIMKSGFTCGITRLLENHSIHRYFDSRSDNADLQTALMYMVNKEIVRVRYISALVSIWKSQPCEYIVSNNPAENGLAGSVWQHDC